MHGDTHALPVTCLLLSPHAGSSSTLRPFICMRPPSSCSAYLRAVREARASSRRATM